MVLTCSAMVSVVEVGSFNMPRPVCPWCWCHRTAWSYFKEQPGPERTLVAAVYVI